jgi:hypothetical protein
MCKGGANRCKATGTRSSPTGVRTGRSECARSWAYVGCQYVRIANQQKCVESRKPIHSTSICWLKSQLVWGKSLCHHRRKERRQGKRGSKGRALPRTKALGMDSHQVLVADAGRQRLQVEGRGRQKLVLGHWSRFLGRRSHGTRHGRLELGCSKGGRKRYRIREVVKRVRREQRDGKR